MSVFVWVRGLDGPWPQKWDELPSREYGSQMERVVAAHKIHPDEESLSLDGLARRYPAPEPRDDDHV